VALKISRLFSAGGSFIYDIDRESVNAPLLNAELTVSCLRPDREIACPTWSGGE